jgi:hypothetical protein
MASFVTHAVVTSPSGIHNEDSVSVHAEPVSEPMPRPAQHLEPSYESTYQEVHKAEIQRIRALVQTPNLGSFMHADVTWASHMHTKGRRTDPRTRAPVSVAYIPWARVDDFVKGEEARPDAPCKFICRGTPTNDKGRLLFPRWNSYSAVMRCSRNMQLVFHCACSCVTIYCQGVSLLYMALTSTTCCYPHPTDINVNMDRMTMQAT